MTRKRLSDILLVLLLALGIYLWQRTVFPLWMLDCFPDQLGAYFWRIGKPELMYTTSGRLDQWLVSSLPTARSLGLNCDLAPFMYPPFVAALLSPLADVQATVWRNALFLINFLLLFVFALQMATLCGVRLSLRSLLWALALVLLCYPMARATKLSQIVPLISAATWIALLFMRQDKDWLAGVLMGIAGALKLFPLALIVLPVCDRRLRMAVGCLGTVIVIYSLSILTLGLQVHLYWLEAMREFSGLVIPYFGNQSVLGWVTRVVFGFSSLEETPTAIPALILFRAAAVVIFGVPTAFALWRMKGQLVGKQLALSSGIVMAAVLLSLPNAWEHYWLFLLPTLGWAIYETVHHRDTLFWEIWLGAASFFFLMKLTHFSYADTLFSRLMSGSQTFGMLLLWVWLLRRAWREIRRSHVLQTA